LSFLTAINVKNHSEIESFIDVLIELKEEYGNKESKENLKLKDQLIKAHKQLEKLNLEKNNDKNRLEKGALKCFAKGLEFNLINEGKKAIEEYEFALQLKPDLYEALYSWGNCLGYLAKTKEGKESEELYNQAFEKFKKAIEYGASSYNLSCIYASRNDKKNAFKYLNISLKNDEIDIDFVEKDEDWLYYLKDKEFIELLRNY